MLNNEQFERTRRLALRLAGIELAERHRELLTRKSRRIGIVDRAGFEALLHSAEEGDVEASRRVLGLLTTKFTGFFRHPRHFELAAARALRAAELGGVVRVWSAAAATGEEPYSMAMALVEAFQREDPPAKILATDVDEDALAAAGRGEYGDRELQTLTANQRERCFQKTSIGRWMVTPQLRALVEFRVLNLVSLSWNVEGPFDVIFCRNVLMYLESACRHAVLEQMASLLAPDGLLILDPTEHLGRAAHLFGPGNHGVHTRLGVVCPSGEWGAKR